MFPVIVVFADVVAVSLAGWLTSLALLDMSPQTFIRGARLFYEHFDLIYSVIKAFSFGLVITLSAATRASTPTAAPREWDLDHARGGGRQGW